MICQRPIHIKEIGPTPLKSAYHIGARNIMAALLDPGRNSTQRQPRRCKSKIDYFNQVSPPLPVCDTAIRLA